ncbi:peptidoglycan-binding protein [Streptomyces sp. NPDC048001]|uniref:peptidoglycan-binding protein n=1 Tax=Streptomyces sp. NPDC048001 TaxID=3365498 RepID=UPI003714E37E
MTADDDLLVALGRQVLAQLLRTYVTSGSGNFALAVLPGQAVDDDMVQEGVVNPLLVSEWLRADYDFPLLLRLSDCTPVPAALGTGISASSIYTLIAQYGRPVAAPDTDAGMRVRDLFILAKADLGPNPGALPLGIEPDDWAAPTGAVHWKTVDTTATSTATSPPAGNTGETALPKANPALWKLRSRHWAQAVQGTPRSALLALVADRATALQDAVATGEGTALAPSEVVTAREHAALSDTALTMLPTLRPTAFTAGPEPAPEPSATTTPTSGGELHVHFEHTLVRMVRRLAGTPWWHPELIEDPGWYLPGMRRGQLVPAPPEGGTAHCLPQALLLVRDVRITGSWTAEAHAALDSAAPAFGPFLLHPGTGSPATADGSGTTTVLGLGTQVIGILGTPMPALPPTDDPGKPPPPSYEPFPGAAWFRSAPRSPVIHIMGRRLVEEHCSAYLEAPGPQWTEADRASFAKWQHKLGYRGTDADGIPGPASWNALRVPRAA